MAKAPGTLTFGYNISAFGGTPPFTTNIDFTADTPPTNSELTAWLGDCGESWDTNVGPKVSEGCTGGFCVAEYVQEDDVLTIQNVLEPGGASGHPRLPGAAVRLIKNTTRPRGGRLGCCYLMAPVGTAYDDDGVITDANIDNAFNDFLNAAFEADSNSFGATFVQNHGHRTGGHIEYGTPTVVGDVTQAPTVSFLRARYR
jgi:hypothetical protein